MTCGHYVAEYGDQRCCSCGLEVEWNILQAPTAAHEIGWRAFLASMGFWRWDIDPSYGGKAERYRVRALALWGALRLLDPACPPVEFYPGAIGETDGMTD